MEHNKQRPDVRGDISNAPSDICKNETHGDAEEEFLSFPFRNRSVPVTYAPSITKEEAHQVVRSDIFVRWYTRCEQQVPVRQHERGDRGDSTGGIHKTEERIDIHSVEIQSVDMFGARGVGFVKIKADCTLVKCGDDASKSPRRLPGICFLRGNAVSVLVALFVEDNDGDGEDDGPYALLVDQPRIPIGEVSCLELPAGMIDDAAQTIAGIAVQEIKEECGIAIRTHELVDLTLLAFHTRDTCKSINSPPLFACQYGIPPSPGGCDEMCKYMYLEKKVSRNELNDMKGRLTGLGNDHGEHITVKIVPLSQIWKVSADAKAIISLFLLEKLRIERKLPPVGTLATPLESSTPPLGITAEIDEPMLQLNNGGKVPQLAFGLYKVPPDKEGESIISAAIHAGYRHFDTASLYENESTLGRALKRSGLPRQAFYVVSKVWNDAVKQGRAAVRRSVEESIANLDFGGYYDLFLIHWPVPDHFADAYKELEQLHDEGKIRAIGLSNFIPEEYQSLVAEGLRVQPVCNQFEVSPIMYRPNLIKYFQDRGIHVSASKALNRAGACFKIEAVSKIADKYAVSPAQVFLRWSVQKGLIVVAKTSNESRMKENRAVSFSLSEEDIRTLDALTTEEDINARSELEIIRKQSL